MSKVRPRHKWFFVISLPLICNLIFPPYSYSTPNRHLRPPAAEGIASKDGSNKSSILDLLREDLTQRAAQTPAAGVAARDGGAKEVALQVIQLTSTIEEAVEQIRKDPQWNRELVDAFLREAHAGILRGMAREGMLFLFASDMPGSEPYPLSKPLGKILTKMVLNKTTVEDATKKIISKAGLNREALRLYLERLKKIIPDGDPEAADGGTKVATVRAASDSEKQGPSAARDGGMKMAAMLAEEIPDFKIPLSSAVLQSKLNGTIAVYEEALNNLTIARQIEILAEQLRRQRRGFGFSLISTSGKPESEIVEEILRDSNGAVDLRGAFQTTLVKGEVDVLNPRAVASVLEARGLPLLELVAPPTIVSAYRIPEVKLYAWLVSGNPKEGEAGIANGAKALREMIELLGLNQVEREKILRQGGVAFTVEIRPVAQELQEFDQLYRVNRGV